MRTWVFAVMIATSTAGVAAAQDASTNRAHQALFYRLTVPRQSLPNGSQKSVGGLTCTVKSKPGGAGSLFNCVLADAPDAAAIYEALNMQGTKMPGAGSAVFVKTSGLLRCTRTERGQDVAYACGWQLSDGPPRPEGATGSSAATGPADAAVPDPSGVYSGTYSCRQGETPLTLTLHDEGNGRLAAVFSFSISVRSGSPAEIFSYHLQGRHDPTRDTRLTPTKWESKRPSGYSMVGMSGRFDHEAGVFSGRITSPGCTTFSVTRDKTARQPSKPKPESRAAAPTTVTAAAPKPDGSAPAATAASPFAKDPRLDAVPPDMRPLVIADADKAEPYCEASPALSDFLDCGCVGQRVFDHRMETADYALAKTFSAFFASRDFMKRLTPCVVPEKVEGYARGYVAKMESLSPAARECAVADFLRAFNKAPAPEKSLASRALRNAMSACNLKHR